MTTLALTWRPIESKYVEIAKVALRARASERAVLVLRSAFYVLILMVFSRLWAAIVPNSGDYVWYLAIAEWATLAHSRTFQSIERDVRSGDVTCMLARPVSYLATKLAEGAGELVTSLVVLAVVGSSTATVLAGAPHDPVGLVAAVGLCLIGAVFTLLCSAWIGVTSFWLQDCTPLYWLWQKLMFVLGGMFVPLALYPGWLRTLAEWSPFSAMLGGPASMVLRFDPALAGLYALKLIACCVLAWHGMQWTYRRALRELELGGG